MSEIVRHIEEYTQPYLDKSAPDVTLGLANQNAIAPQPKTFRFELANINITDSENLRYFREKIIDSWSE